MRGRYNRITRPVHHCATSFNGYFKEVKKVATRADVARLAGVSPATVSYAISGKAPIADETRERVFAAMETLSYTPNVMAQALAGRRSRILAMLLPGRLTGVTNSDMEYMLGAANAARELGYHLLLWPTLDREMEQVLALCQAGLLDGVILMEVRLEDERVELLANADIPFSLIGRTANEEAEILFTDRDFDAGMLAAVEHLVAHGHRNIALLNATRKVVRQGVGAPVRAGSAFKAAIKKSGAKGVQVYCESTIQAGRELAHELLVKHPDVTALVDLNSEAVVGLMQEAQRVPIAIPKRLSVVSVSVSDALAGATMPALTTIAPPANGMGRMAAQLLIAKLSDDVAPTGDRLFAGELVERGSCGPAPKL
jgi:DNA-binding LacI/PurR family transcriptional regulator